MHRNPLIYDNRFDPEPMRRYPRSRTVASIVAPPRQRAQVERLAESPHTFRVVVVDDAFDRDLSSLSQPGCITLVVDLKGVATVEAGTEKNVAEYGKGARLGIYSAFTFLHRLGDALLGFSQTVVTGGGYYYTDDWGLSEFKKDSRATAYVPTKHLSEKTTKLSKKVNDASRIQIYDPEYHWHVSLWESRWTKGLSNYIVHHTNSHMAREGLRFGPHLDDLNMTQCLADWLALSEMPSARARPGRGEPWLLFPPARADKQWSPEVKKKIRAYVKTINTYFPLFAQSLLDDLDGAVFRI